MTPPRPSATPTTSDLPEFTEPKRTPLDELDPKATTVTPPPPDLLEPATPAADSPAPAPTNGKSTTTSAPASSSAFEDDELGAELPPQSPTSSSRAGPSRVFSTDPSVFEKPIAGLVQLASLGVHYVRRVEPPLWLADDDDVANITAPLARIAARHVPVGDGQASDLADGFEAALATTNYVVKNIAAQAQMRPRRPEGRVPEAPPAPTNGDQPFPPAPATGP